LPSEPDAWSPSPHPPRAVSATRRENATARLAEQELTTYVLDKRLRPIHPAISAAEVEAAAVGQVRALLRQPEIIVGTWTAARGSDPDLTEAETRDALHQLQPLWDELFPAEQARIVRLLVEKVTVSRTRADIRLRVEGLSSLVWDLGTGRPTMLKAAE
jgi:hypothetical protein